MEPETLEYCMKISNEGPIVLEEKFVNVVIDKNTCSEFVIFKLIVINNNN